MLEKRVQGKMRIVQCCDMHNDKQNRNEIFLQNLRCFLITSWHFYCFFILTKVMYILKRDNGNGLPPVELSVR